MNDNLDRVLQILYGIPEACEAIDRGHTIHVTCYRGTDLRAVANALAAMFGDTDVEFHLKTGSTRRPPSE